MTLEVDFHSEAFEICQTHGAGHVSALLLKNLRAGETDAPQTALRADLKENVAILFQEVNLAHPGRLFRLGRMRDSRCFIDQQPPPLAPFCPEGENAEQMSQ